MSDTTIPGVLADQAAKLDAADGLRATRAIVMRSDIRNEFRCKVDFAVREIGTGADVTLSAGLLQIFGIDH